MIEAIVMDGDREFNKIDLIKELGVSLPSVYTAFKTCTKFHLIMKTRQIANSKLYTLNKSNPLVPKLKALIMELSCKKFEMEMDDNEKIL